MLGQVKNAVAAGYPASQIIQQLHDLILKDGSLSNTDKGVVMEQLAIADDRLADGGAPRPPASPSPPLVALSLTAVRAWTQPTTSCS